MYPFLLRVITTALLLNGCATANLWGGYGDTRHKTQTQQETDCLLAFARTQAESQHLPPNSLVMLGEHYIYMVERSHAFGEWSSSATENNSALLAVLNTKLSHAFELHSENASGIKIGTTRLNGIPVSISPQHFSSAFCLQYSENAQLSANAKPFVLKISFQTNRYKQQYTDIATASSARSALHQTRQYTV